MSEFAIEVKNISKTFRVKKQTRNVEGEFQSREHKGISKLFQKRNSGYQQTYLRALDNVSFTVRKGEVLGIIGLNGGGKTTLLQVISGIYQPNSGEIKINGSLAPILGIGTGFNPELLPSETLSRALKYVC